MPVEPAFHPPDLPGNRGRVELARLEIQSLRNLESLDLPPANGVNVILGPNGAGKTSVLEAIWLLSRGRSFRSGRVDQVVSEGSRSLRVVGRVRTDRGGEVVVGCERGRGERTLRVAGQAVDSVAEMTRLLPAVVFEPHAHELVEGGPENRRRFLDWGVFHVEPGFLEAWRGFQRALRQRNVCLRERDARGAGVWEEPMARAGERLSAMRSDYAARLMALVPGVMKGLAPEMGGIGGEYRAGWGREETLAQALAGARENDRRMGFTSVGPHRGELRLTMAGKAAARRLSRGQEKLVALGLILAQTLMFIRDTGRTPVVLLDDLPSELDAVHLENVVRWVSALGAQVFATSVDWPGAFGAWPEPVRRFHVEQGRLAGR